MYTLPLRLVLSVTRATAYSVACAVTHYGFQGELRSDGNYNVKLPRNTSVSEAREIATVFFGQPEARLEQHSYNAFREFHRGRPTFVGEVWDEVDDRCAGCGTRGFLGMCDKCLPVVAA